MLAEVRDMDEDDGLVFIDEPLGLSLLLLPLVTTPAEDGLAPLFATCNPPLPPPGCGLCG